MEKTNGDTEKTQNRLQVDSGFISFLDGDSSVNGSQIKNVDSGLEVTTCSVKDSEEIKSSVKDSESSKKQNQIEPTVASLTTPKNMSNANFSANEIYDNPRVFFKQGPEGNTLLHMAIVSNMIGATFLLIERSPESALLDIANDDHLTPLHLAVLMRDARTVRRLLLGGANPKRQTLYGSTPLHLACRTGDLACVKALTALPTPSCTNILLRTQRQFVAANPEAKDYCGRTCLHVAVIKGYEDVANYLIIAGAKITAPEGLAGRTAMHLAVEYGHWKIFHLLLNHQPSCLLIPAYDSTTPFKMIKKAHPQLADTLRKSLDILPEVESESNTDSVSDSETDSDNKGDVE